ncbi:MAG TPA: TolC family protein, partial [Candidatus Krumholzibacterium sp.]|nr:TolC family protein [Candidatus Krumholzibacterium sp.]
DSPLEATKARVAHSGMIVQHERAKGDLEVARARLAATWGGAEAGFGRAAGDLGTISPVPGFKDLLALLGENPEIVRSMIDKDSKDAALALERATAIPDLTIRGGMKRFAGSGDNSLILGLSIPIPLFDRNRDGRLMAYHEAAAADENLKAVNLSVRTRLVEAYSRLSAAYREADRIDSSIMESAEALHKASRVSYDEGKVDYLMVLDAQRTLFELKTHYIDVLVSYHSAKVEVEKLIGRSLESVGIEEREETR